MSILIKGNNGSSVGGGPSKGFPPGDITNISVRSGTRCVLLNFSDPDSSIYNNITLSTWYSTIIVRKEASAPTSIKDGDIVLTNTTRNKYKNNYFVDNNVTVDKTYYYRFYTMSTDKVYNDSTSMIRSVKVLEVDPILRNNTWEQIAAASESGIASSIWKIGDEIDLTLSGTFNETVTLQIWDFNHFDKSDGSCKAGICFGMKHLMKDYQQMNSSRTNSGGWNNTTMRNTTMKNVFNSMPSNLQNIIKEVNTYANQGTGSSSFSAGRLSTDKVFSPGITELDANLPDQNRTETNQKLFPIFTDDNSRIKKMNNGGGDACWWCTRSPAYLSYSAFFGVLKTGGTTYSEYCDGDGNGVCFCFNV